VWESDLHLTLPETVEGADFDNAYVYDEFIEKSEQWILDGLMAHLDVDLKLRLLKKCIFDLEQSLYM
jgi:hypothetical protein